MKKIITAKELVKKGYPRLLIPGIILAMAIGVGGIINGGDYYKNKTIFPDSGMVIMVEDGDTFELDGGQRVRFVGINAPERGKENYDKAKSYLENELLNNKVWLEYDRYQDDKYGRVLAWVWTKCVTDEPKFLPANYMHLDGKTSREFIEKKPEGCKNGELMNKKLVEDKVVVPINYEKRGKLKYRLE